MYIRFVILKKDQSSHQQQGIFQAAYHLRDNGNLEVHEYDWIERELGWLKRHLKSPECLRHPGTERAISWFKPVAHRPIALVRSLAALLEEHGYLVRMVKTADPGRIIYEDGWQVVAYPRRNRGGKATQHQ